MLLRSVVSMGLVLLFGAGCVTSTAHMLPVAGNPLQAQAQACELACHRLLVPPPKPADCERSAGLRTNCIQAYPDRSGYARCLDTCPGARAIDGSSCPDPPLPGVACEETHRANAGGIIGGAVGVGAITLLLVVVVAIASLPVIILL